MSKHKYYISQLRKYHHLILNTKDSENDRIFIWYLQQVLQTASDRKLYECSLLITTMIQEQQLKNFQQEIDSYKDYINYLLEQYNKLQT